MDEMNRSTVADKFKISFSGGTDIISNNFYGEQLFDYLEISYENILIYRKRLGLRYEKM